MKPEFLSNINCFRICIVCEGYEEFDYFDKLVSLNVFNGVYSFELENAKGNGNIFSRYQDKYQSDAFDVVLIFCDTERKPCKQYSNIKVKINEFHDNENAASKVIIFGNPCTMQIILSHFADVKIRRAAKSKNAPLIKELTGISNYNANGEKRKALMDQINEENYWRMLNALKDISDDDTEISSTNFYYFANLFMEDDGTWIDELNDIL